MIFLEPKRSTRNADHRGEDSRFQATQACCKGDLGVTPPELLDKGFKKRSEPVHGDSAHIETDGKAGAYNPPPVEDSCRHNHFSVYVTKYFQRGFI